MRSAARGGPQVAIRAARVPTRRRRPRPDEPDRHDGGVARALGGGARLASELIVSERTRHEIQEPRPDQGPLLPEVALARLADRAHPELVVEDEEGGGLAGEGVARAAQDHPHAAAVAHALPQLGMPRRILRRVAAAGAEPDRLGPALPNWRPRPIDPNESRHAERSQHGTNVRARGAQSMHRFGTEPCAKSAQVRLGPTGWPFNSSSGDPRP